MSSEHQHLDSLDRLSVQIETLHRLSVTSNDPDRSVIDSLLTEKTKSLCLLSEGMNCTHQAIKADKHQRYTLFHSGLPLTDRLQLAPTHSPCLTVEASGITIGARIRQLRKERMLTQAELANMLDLIPEDIADWEEETCPVEAEYIIPLANALKCDPMWLLSGNPLDVKAVSPAPINVMKGADLANIGVRIESRRNELGMSPLKLAEKIDTSRAMILEWETGKAIPYSGYYDKLAKALNTSVTWLMTGKDITGEHKNQHDENAAALKELESKLKRVTEKSEERRNKLIAYRKDVRELVTKLHDRTEWEELDQRL
ncbi:helix-turn-helix domain-containing protein [Salmonella enterica]|nr:helix-turn-helix domain-containing protein [Salmonella enterica]